jgi:hypothetical protein
MQRQWLISSLVSLALLLSWLAVTTPAAAAPAPTSFPASTNIKVTASPRPSLSPTPIVLPATASPSAEVRRLLRQRVENALQEAKITQSNTLVGLVGSVVKVGTSTFSLTDVTGNEHTVQVATDTEIWQKKTKLLLKDLALQSGVTVYALPLDNNVIEAKRVIVRDDNFVEHRKVWIGTVRSLDKTKLTLTVRGDMPEQSWILDRAVIYEDSVNTKLTAKQIQADSAALVITNEAEPGKTMVTRIHLLVPIRKDVL